MKINKACDLSSISVLPPHARRLSGVGTSASGKSQMTHQQLRSQSQPSFSQGVSLSQPHGIFSQLSQNTPDETLTNTELRIGSQEREHSAKRISGLLPSSHPRDESQTQLARSSTNLMRRWSVPEQKCQVNEELDQRIGTIEASLNRMAIILDSIQSDIMQVNKGTKEVVLEIESIRQKLIFHDDSVQLVNKGQEDIKSLIREGFKAISDQVKHHIHQDHIQNTTTALSALPNEFERCVHRMQSDLCKTLSKEIQAMACTIKIPCQKPANPTSHLPSGNTYHSASRDVQSLRKPVHAKVQQAPLVSKNDMGGWKSVKREQASLKDRTSKRPNKKEVNPCQQDKVIVESDDIDEGFSCLLHAKENDDYFGGKIAEDAKEEIERMLRKARRRKRKHCNPIIID